MTLDRRKVLIYLRPDISASERFADAKIEAHHRGDRGDMSRTALLAEDTKPETLRKMLASFLEIQPASPALAAAPAAAPAKAPAAAPAKAPEPPAPVSESVSARNLAGSLPD